MTRFAKILLALIVLTFVVGLVAAAATTQDAAATIQDETQGKLTAVFPDKREFILAGDGQQKDRTFQLDKMGKVLINNNEAQLSELQPGEEVRVIFEMQMERPVATEVRCTRF